jgi:hypothetical protein
MELYYVYKIAPSKHELVGLFDCFLLARVEAIYAVIQRDSYCSFEICKLLLNENYIVEKRKRYTRPEASKIYEVYKEQTHKEFTIKEETVNHINILELNKIPDWLTPESMIVNSPTWAVADKYDDLGKPLLANAIRKTFNENI